MSWLTLAVSASAQDVAPPYAIDIELVRPSFGHQGFSGVDAPLPGGRLTTRYGAILQYEEAPLTLVEAVGGTELGAVVAHRLAGAIGMSLDVERATFSVLVPGAGNWGTELGAFGNDGAGFGDIGASARVVVVDAGRVHGGVRGGVILPTGRQGLYLGEAGPRLGAGLLASLEAGPLTVASDLGLSTRTAVRTQEDFLAANELSWGNAARLALPDATRLAGTVQVLTRAGLADFLMGGAENSAEMLAGIEVYPTRRATFGLEAGRGLTQGYGTTDLRLLTSLVIETGSREPPVEYVVRADVAIGEFGHRLVEDEPVDFGGKPAVQFGNEIFIQEMVEFVVDTDVLQPYSLPTLEAVAAVINGTRGIGHLVIEGHASHEGSYEHNYALAEARAQKIWEFLLEHGVAEERVSYRGLGEVRPLESGEDEGSLQKNRRVRFVIVRQIPEGGPFPTYPPTQVLPWTGTEVPVVQPSVPAGPRFDAFGLPIDDDLDVAP